MKKILMAAAVTAFLAGCASNVKLDDVPVVDRSGTTVAPADSGSAGANAANTTRSQVEPVRIADPGANMTGPSGVGRIVYFDYDSFSVKPEYQQVIESHARFLKAAPNRKVVVEGNTDERGGREYNLALGQKRSEAVRRALGLLGVADNQVEAVSFGEEKPADNGTSEDAFAKNRRAEISYR